MSLNDLLCKWGLKENNKCDCWDPETIDHYLLCCPKYEDERERLKTWLFQTLDVASVNLDLLLNTKPNDEHKDNQAFIISELKNTFKIRDVLNFFFSLCQPKIAVHFFSKIPVRLYLSYI